MNTLPLNNVRKLALREIAEMWPTPPEIPRSIVLRELRIAVLNIPRKKQGLPLLDEPPPDHELPDPDTRVNKNWLEDFCMKQGWGRPEFWFGKLQVSERYPGRPTIKPAIWEKFEERRESGEVLEKISHEAKWLLEWAQEKYRGVPSLPNSQAAVENQIRDKYNEYKMSLVKAK